jgi:hypothetical protein
MLNVWKQHIKENFWPVEVGSKLAWRKYLTKNFSICTPYLMLGLFLSKGSRLEQLYNWTIQEDPCEKITITVFHACLSFRKIWVEHTYQGRDVLYCSHIVFIIISSYMPLLQAITDLLLKGVQFPYYCAKAMMEGQALF